MTDTNKFNNNDEDLKDIKETRSTAYVRRYDYTLSSSATIILHPFRNKKENEKNSRSLGLALTLTLLGLRLLLLLLLWEDELIKAKKILWDWI